MKRGEREAWGRAEREVSEGEGAIKNKGLNIKLKIKFSNTFEGSGPNLFELI